MSRVVETVGNVAQSVCVFRSHGEERRLPKYSVVAELMEKDEDLEHEHFFGHSSKRMSDVAGGSADALRNDQETDEQKRQIAAALDETGFFRFLFFERLMLILSP